MVLDGTVVFAARPYGPGGPESIVVADRRALVAVLLVSQSLLSLPPYEHP